MLEKFLNKTNIDSSPTRIPTRRRPGRTKPGRSPIAPPGRPRRHDTPGPERRPPRRRRRRR